ncbi:hypothetical protein GCM10011357_25730 [Lacimicrobium alkaliphilum]|uniref:DUF885 domain-containing protein n=2 Tax=Lacimicrobium alkaliphilum TaxID=1526571 RepID=A0ABQ1RIM7_9ALTE|nr:hypothetical protein GCM10011357_25730 [Lacimicrobium alkaliphilum]
MSFFTDRYIRKSVWIVLAGLIFAATVLNYVVLELYAFNREKHAVPEPPILNLLDTSFHTRANVQQADEIVDYYFTRWLMKKELLERYQQHDWHYSEATFFPGDSFYSFSTDITPAFKYLDMTISQWHQNVELGNFDLMRPLAFLYAEMNWWPEHVELHQDFYAVTGYTNGAYRVMAQSPAVGHAERLMFGTLMNPGDAEEPIDHSNPAIDMLDKEAIAMHLNKITPDGRLAQLYLAFIEEQKRRRQEYRGRLHFNDMSNQTYQRMQRWQGYLSQFE